MEPAPKHADKAADIRTKKLSPVRLTKTDTCWTYCLKRVGYRMDSDTMAIAPTPKPNGLIPMVSVDHNRIEEFFDLLPLSVIGAELGYTQPEPALEAQMFRKLQPGDLLIFSHNETIYYLHDSIDADGNIEATGQKIRRHIAVYEGNDVISHLTQRYTGPNYESFAGMEIEMLLLMTANDITGPHKLCTKPSHILKLKK